MTTQQEATPTITNPGTKPTKSRKLFVNIAVNDLQRSIIFFETLGFAFNPQFTDATGTCMLVGDDAYFMLLTKEKFQGFSKRPMGDSNVETNAMFAISVDNREDVDSMHKEALAAGGTNADDAQDLGFMYMRSFRDLDGHHWEVFWMDPAAVNG